MEAWNPTCSCYVLKQWTKVCSPCRWTWYSWRTWTTWSSWFPRSQGWQRCTWSWWSERISRAPWNARPVIYNLPWNVNKTVCSNSSLSTGDYPHYGDVPHNLVIFIVALYWNYCPSLVYSAIRYFRDWICISITTALLLLSSFFCRARWLMPRMYLSQCGLLYLPCFRHSNFHRQSSLASTSRERSW
jgi:hypothetical protein